jgi:hypothetical protein
MLLAWVAVLMGACGGTDPPGAEPGEPGSEPPAQAAGWRAVPPGPLSPRENALALWTGSEVLLIGGSDAPPCPPSADCTTPTKPPLGDGAAYDPATETWRRIADSPVRVEWANGVVIGQTAYLWIPGNNFRPDAEQAFLAYRIDEDRWEALPPPPTNAAGWYSILAAGDRLIAYSGSDEQVTAPDLVFDPTTGTWSELPDDPLGPAYDRSMAWTGHELVLFDKELVPNPCGGEMPCLVRAAVYDFETGSWRRLPDSELLGSGPWYASNGSLVNPVLGGADGGDNEWGRTYPYGGLLDPATGEWSALPRTPFAQDDFSGAGALTETGGHYFGHRGWILDTTTDEWIEIPPLDDDELGSGRTVVAAGDDLFVFGGVRWPERSPFEGELLADAWIWSPRG